MCTLGAYSSQLCVCACTYLVSACLPFSHTSAILHLVRCRCLPLSLKGLPNGFVLHLLNVILRPSWDAICIKDRAHRAHNTGTQTWAMQCNLWVTPWCHSAISRVRGEVGRSMCIVNTASIHHPGAPSILVCAQSPRQQSHDSIRALGHSCSP